MHGVGAAVGRAGVRAQVVPVEVLPVVPATELVISGTVVDPSASDFLFFDADPDPDPTLTPIRIRILP